MGDAQTVGSLVVAAVLGGIGLWWSRRQLRSAGVGTVQSEINKGLRELAATWEEKYNLEHEARVTAQAALAEAKAEQLLERKIAARDRVDLDDARSDIRTLERRPRRPREDS